MKKLANGLGHVTNSLPPGLRNALPPELTLLATVGNLTADEFGWFENKFLAMQKHILVDETVPEEAHQIVASPVEDRIFEQRLTRRGPKLADDLTDRRISADARLRFHWPLS